MIKNPFATERVARVTSNWFDLTHNVLTTTKFGRLTPTFVQECLPGDKFVCNSENLIRFAPLTAPVMHRVKVYTHFFFVPNRILWPEWESFITGGQDGTLNPPMPGFSGESLNFTKGSLADYLGFPLGVNIPQSDVNALVFSAYHRIFYDYYRDQNLDGTFWQPLTNGNTNSLDLLDVKYRAWRKDYFTASLPFAQRGAPVELPLGTFEDVPVSRRVTGASQTNDRWETISSASGNPVQNTYVTTRNAQPTTTVPTNYLYAETSKLEGESALVSDLRRAIRLQEFFEKLARGGSRYFEVLRNFFGVRNLDSRLDRAEYIGGNIQPVVISEVLQTSETTNDSPQANMAGHGVSSSFGKKNSYFCPEHGWIIGITSVMPDAVYNQGVPRFFSYRDRFDYYWSSFAHIGEQEVLNKELYVTGNPTLDNGTFGYIPRYSQYRYRASYNTGDFRDTLDFWTFSRRFGNQPNLNTQFVYVDPDSDYLKKPFAFQGDEDYLWMQVVNHVRSRRPVAKFGSPLL